MATEVAISVKGVAKHFKLPHERSTTVKGVFVNMLRSKLSRRYERQKALQDINLEIKKGEFFGIVGRNGSGKSTLLKILAGIYQPSKGSVKINGRLVPFIELGVGFNSELTGRENVYLNGAMLNFSQEEIDQMYDEIVEFAELERFMDQKLKNYSSGMQVRLAFSMAIRADADILLVDEVLAVGDADFQRKCLEYFRLLKKNKKTVIFVSHDMNSVKQFCDRAAFIEKSKLIMVDDSDKVADAYTKMFLEESKKNKTGQKRPTGKRWGDGAAEYISVEVMINESLESIQIDAHVKATGLLQRPNYGFLIKNFSGQTILGWNTNLAGLRTEDLGIGKTAKLSWTVPHIFNEGIYYIDVSMSYNQGVTADWWEEAAEFTVTRDKNTPYIINPKVITKVVQ